jgi:hypothetical protein
VLAQLGREMAVIDLADEVEIALLCYEVAPNAIPAEIATLADAAPGVVIVPADPVEVGA